MKRHIILLLMLLLAFVATTYAQGWRGMGRIQGVVTDLEGQPMKGAKVMLRSKRAANTGPDVITDAKGKWVVAGLISGGWNIDVEAEGYLPKQISIEISEVQRMPPLKMQLEPMPKPVVEEQVEEQPVANAVPPEIVQVVEAGETYMKEKKFREAIIEFEKALAVLPEHVQLKQVLAQAYYGAGQTKMAVEILEQVHAADPANVGVRLLLINLLLENGQLDKGKALLENVPEGTIADPMPLINIGILFLNKEKPQEAYDFFNRAIGIDVNRGETYYYRGIASLQLRNMKGAKADFEKVVALSPDSTEAKDAAEMLKQMK